MFLQFLKSKYASDYQNVEVEHEEEKERKVGKNSSKEPSKQPTLHQSIQEIFLDVRNWTLL